MPGNISTTVRSKDGLLLCPICDQPTLTVLGARGDVAVRFVCECCGLDGELHFYAHKGTTEVSWVKLRETIERELFKSR